LDDEAVKFSADPIVPILVCHETQPKQNLRELTAQDHSQRERENSKHPTFIKLPAREGKTKFLGTLVSAL
jgi:hypothetical protein